MRIKDITGTRKIASIGRRLFAPSAEHFPTIRNGLRWGAPLHDNGRSVYDDGIVAYVDPSTQDVDADGTYIDTYDILQDAILDELRIEKNGWRNEDTRENVLLRSQEADHASWDKVGGATVTANQGVAPDGTTTADQLEMATHAFGAYLAQNVGSGTGDWSSSCWVKKPGGGSDATHVRLTSNNRAAWDTGGSKKITLTTEWQYVEMNYNLASGDPRWAFGSTDVSGVEDPDCLGNVLIWGMQGEVGKFATRYIRTTGSSKTRTYDDLRYTAAGNIDGDACTIVMAITPDVSGADGNLGRFFRWRAGTHWIVGYILNGSWNFNIANGTNIEMTGTTDILKGRTDIIIFTHDGAANEQKLYVNGVKEGPTRTKSEILGTATIFSIGSSGGGTSVLPGNYQHNYIYDRALSAAECASLTTEIEGWMA